MEFRVLGPLEAVHSERVVELGGTREGALLAILLLDANRTVLSSRLVDELWDTAPPDRAMASLRVHVSRLRKSLGAGGAALETRAAGYQLRVEPDAYDALAFEQEARAGRERLHRGEASVAADVLRAALARWRGAAFVDVGWPPSVRAEAARLEEARLGALEDRIEAELACGRHDALAAELEALTARHPLRERLWGHRMLALYRCGRQADALRAFQELRHLLADELGIDPSPAIRRLEQSILAQEPALDWGAAGTGGPRRTGRLPSGVVTFLLTDVEGSTRLWETDPDEMALALARHDEIIGAAIRSHGGVVLKARGEGDSTFSVFARATEAADAALEIQRALLAETWPERIPLRARIAVHTGEAHERDGDYFGPTVNRAARLRSVAAGGEILLSQSTTEVVSDHLSAGGSTLVPLGSRPLAGLARPERVYALLPGGPGEEGWGGSPAVSLPAVLATPRGTFVGRARELERLGRAWEAAAAGTRQAVFLSGEPGIGKSRLAAEVAAQAYAQGALVLYGRCDEDALVPYQPFVEAVGHLAVAWPTARLQQRLGPLTGGLVRLLPQLRSRLSSVPPASSDEPETERFHLFEAVASLLGAASDDRPLLLILDDLHWADRGTLLLLRHLLRHEDVAPLLVIGAYRETEVTATHPLADALAGLHREQRYERLAVKGLSVGEVRALLAAASEGAADPAPAFGEAVHRETDGNPFFVEEIVRHMAEAGMDGSHWPDGLRIEDIGIPQSIKEVIGRRLTRLSPPALTTLTAAAVVGREFSTSHLEAIFADGDAALDAIEEALAAGIVAETAVEDVYTFSHALVREILYDQLSAIRRVRMHHQVGEAIERLHAERLDEHLAELAHHFLRAASAGDLDKAITYARRAGEQALDGLGYEEASRQFEAAMDALELRDVADEPLRAELLLALGDARWRAGDLSTARESFLAAADIARRESAPELLARAALGVGHWLTFTPSGQFGPAGTVDGTRVALLEEALAALPETDSPLRAKVLARLGFASYWAPNRERRVDLTRDAVAMAERVGDGEALTHALFARRQALLGPEDVEERLDTDVRALRLAELAGDTRRGLDARMWWAMDLLELGEVAAADAAIDAHDRMSLLLRQAEPRWNNLVIRAQRAAMDGRFADAEALANQALTAGQALDEMAALSSYGGQMLWLWREQGRTPELEGAMSGILGMAAAMPAAQAGLALTYLDLGRAEQARRVFDGLAEAGFANLPRDLAWLASMAALSLVCAGLGDAERARELYSLLAPYEGRNLVVMFGPCFGPASYYLGLLAAAGGDDELAGGHFEEATVMAQSMGSRPFLAHAQVGWARILGRSAEGPARHRALPLTHRALATAEELAMAPLIAEARALVASLASDRAARRSESVPAP